MKKYFSYSADSGFQLYDTRQEAIQFATNEVDDDLSDSLNRQGLSANLETIVCGELTHYVNMFVPVPNEEYLGIELEEIPAQKHCQSVKNDDSYSHDFNIGMGEHYFNVTKKEGENPVFNLEYNSASGCDTTPISRESVINLVNFLTGFINDTHKSSDTIIDWG